MVAQASRRPGRRPSNVASSPSAGRERLEQIDQQPRIRTDDEENAARVSAGKIVAYAEAVAGAEVEGCLVPRLELHAQAPLRGPGHGVGDLVHPGGNPLEGVPAVLIRPHGEALLGDVLAGEGDEVYLHSPPRLRLGAAIRPGDHARHSTVP